MRRIANFFQPFKKNDAGLERAEETKPTYITIHPPAVPDYGLLLVKQILLQVAGCTSDRTLIALRQCSTSFWCALSEVYETRRKVRAEPVWLASFSRILADIARDKLLLGVTLKTTCVPREPLATHVRQFTVFLRDDKEPLRIRILAMLHCERRVCDYVREEISRLVFANLEDVTITESHIIGLLQINVSYAKKGRALQDIIRNFWAFCHSLGQLEECSYKIENLLSPGNELTAWLRDQSAHSVLVMKPYCTLTGSSLLGEFDNWSQFRLSDAWRTPTVGEQLQFLDILDNVCRHIG